MLKIRNLNKKYLTIDGEIVALDNVSLFCYLCKTPKYII